VRRTVTAICVSGLLLLQLPGCAGTLAGPESAKLLVAGPKPGHGVVYVGRPYGWNVSYIPLSVELNGRPLAQLGIDNYTRVELRPGMYKLAAADTYLTSVAYGKPLPLSLTVEAGRSYYVLPTRKVENLRPSVQIIGTYAVPTQTGDVYGGFAIQTPAAGGHAPAAFAQMSYVVPEISSK